MRGVYDTFARIANLSVAQAVFSLAAPSSKIVELLELTVTPETPQNQQFVIEIDRASAAGSGGNAPLALAPKEAGDQAAGSTVLYGLFSGSDPTASTSLFREGQTGQWQFFGGRENSIFVPPSGIIFASFKVAPSSFNAIVRATFREIG